MANTQEQTIAVTDLSKFGVTPCVIEYVRHLSQKTLYPYWLDPPTTKEEINAYKTGAIGWVWPK